MSTAKPMNGADRLENYMRQNGSILLTPRQSRRFHKKLRRELKAGGDG